jgi:hypothetical protein
MGPPLFNGGNNLGIIARKTYRELLQPGSGCTQIAGNPRKEVTV